MVASKQKEWRCDGCEAVKRLLDNNNQQKKKVCKAREEEWVRVPRQKEPCSKLLCISCAIAKHIDPLSHPDAL